MERFIRACPLHHLVLEELRDGRLRCPRSPHRVTAWLVVDLESGEALGAGRAQRLRAGDPPPTVFLGPRLRFAADLLDLEPRRFALPLPAHPAAA